MTQLPARKILVDGRVYSSAAYDRGMGRYVSHLVSLLSDEGYDVTLLLFRNCYLPSSELPIAGNNIRFANYDPESFLENETERQIEAHRFTAYLSNLVNADAYDIYIDATPFLGPCRLDLLSCAVIAVCYDFIPLKHPDFYLTHPGVRIYYSNGLLRLIKADAVISISETTAAEAEKFLGISAERLSVVTPRLESIYETASTKHPSNEKPYLFQILGSHKSKNPLTSIEIFKEVLRNGKLDVRVNAPKPDQWQHLTTMGMPSKVVLTHSISDAEKFSLQSNATVICHLSLEEGFGIPLLEAVFLQTKIIAIDIPMNREILGKATAEMAGAVMLLPPEAKGVSPQSLTDFLNAKCNAAFYDQIITSYLDHWNRSSVILTQAVNAAAAHHRRWLNEVGFKIFSSVPGTSCGVADYSVAYARSAPNRNIAFFLSQGDERYVSHLPNVRTSTAADFGNFTKSQPHVPGFFNFAFSDALYPGIELLRRYAAKGDALLIHERQYAAGLNHFLSGKPLDDFIVDQISIHPEQASAMALSLSTSIAFNHRTSTQGNPGFTTDWLRQLPVRFVHHLPEPVLQQMRLAAAEKPDTVVNDLVELEDLLEFAPLGIDPRAHPAVCRAAKALRRRRGIQPDDIVVGHFGLILADVKRLQDVATSVFQKIRSLKVESKTPHRVFFALVGKVIDTNLFDRIVNDFAAADLSARLIHTNPAEEQDFDAEIAACDAVFCLRHQRRGQLSHIFVRALSMGVPVIVNTKSGYSYDESTTVRDEYLADDIDRVMDLLLAGGDQRQLRINARYHYEQHHRGDESLQQIFRGAL